MIEVDRVSVVYPGQNAEELRALDAVSLQVMPGERVALVGQNGSGKSTLARCLAALLMPSLGEIRVDGIVVSHANRWQVRSRVALVLQDPDDQIVANRVVDDVAFGPENLGVPHPELGERVEGALRLLQLESLRDAAIETLSPGEKQRVAVAGALAMRPRYLVLDEPTSYAAQADGQRLVHDLFVLAAEQDMALIHITHRMSEVSGFDRVVVLHEGVVVADGAPRLVFDKIALLREIGLDVPAPVAVAHALRARGLAIGAVLNDDELQRELARLVGRA